MSFIVEASKMRQAVNAIFGDNLLENFMGQLGAKFDS